MFEILSPDSAPIFLASLSNVPGGRVHHEFVRSEEELQKFIGDYNHPGRALYRTVAQLREPDEEWERNKWRCKNNVTDTVWIWGEVDFKHHPDIPSEEIQRRLLAMQPAATKIVHSGHGLHVYWRLAEREDASPGEGQRRVEEVLRLACAHIGGDPQVAETARLMRLVGSHNTRVSGEKLPVEIIHHDPEIMYDLGALEDAFLGEQPILPAVKAKPKEANGHTEFKASEWTGPIETETALAEMRFGSKDNGINKTQLKVSAKLISAGHVVEGVVGRILRATQEAVKDDERTKGWDWNAEAAAILDMCYRWINKRMKDDGEDLSHTLSDKLYTEWRERREKGLRPAVVYHPASGWHVRGYPWERPEKKAAGAGAEEAPADEEAPGREDVPPRERKHRFRLISFNDMRPGVEQPYLVDELIPSKGIVLVWGAPKTYKSFVMLDMMLHVAAGWEYRDRAVQRGAVVYCAFEGGHGYRKRIEALRRHYDLEDDQEVLLHIMPGQANLIGDHRSLILDFKAQLGGTAPICVVLDTLNKSLLGSESKDADMSNYIRAAEAIRDAFQCVVIIVHHCGLDETRPRGHTSLPGAVDAQLSVVRQGERVTLTVELMRDGPEEVEVASRVKVVDVGVDANGRTMSSLVVEPADENPAEPGSVGKKWPPSLKVFHGALIEAILAHGVRHQIEGGPLVQAVDVEKVREAFYTTYVVASDDGRMGATAKQLQNTKRKAFARNLERVQSFHLIGGRLVGETQLIWPATFADRGAA